jgi:hypothetical protein
MIVFMCPGHGLSSYDFPQVRVGGLPLIPSGMIFPTGAWGLHQISKIRRYGNIESDW